MADQNTSRPRSTAPDDYDGRFGDQFDDELDVGGIVKTIVGVGVITLLGMIAMLILQGALESRVAEADTVASPIAEANRSTPPPFPRLQAEPEEELEALREAMRERLSSYGWVDEQAGIAHIPIDRAIDLLAETGLAQQESPSTTGDSALGDEEPLAVAVGEPGT